MDGTGFDRITRGLASGASRRKVFGGLLGGAAALVTGAAALEAKKGGNGKGKAKGKTKVTFCHKGKLITVGAPASKAHLKHGDTQCVPGECQVAATGCSATGACEFSLAPATTPCTDPLGAAGTCDAAGVCQPTPVGP